LFVELGYLGDRLNCISENNPFIKPTALAEIGYTADKHKSL
jgi:hypothetical protein